MIPYTHTTHIKLKKFSELNASQWIASAYIQLQTDNAHFTLQYIKTETLNIDSKNGSEVYINKIISTLLTVLAKNDSQILLASGRVQQVKTRKKERSTIDISKVNITPKS